MAKKVPAITVAGAGVKRFILARVLYFPFLIIVKLYESDYGFIKKTKMKR